MSLWELAAISFGYLVSASQSGLARAKKEKAKITVAVVDNVGRCRCIYDSKVLFS